MPRRTAIQSMLKILDNPQNSLSNIFHITGTVGKTSVAKYISSILRAGGYTVNMYLNGNIYPNNKRININGIDIDDNSLSGNIAYIQEKLHSIETELNADEIIFLAALIEFKKYPSYVNIIEVSTGNMNDETNIFQNNQPTVSIICPIHNDHPTENGDTTELNAISQTATIYKNGTIIIGKQTNRVNEFLNQVLTKEYKIYRWNQDFWIENEPKENYFNFVTNWQLRQIQDNNKQYLEYQKENISIACMAIEENINLFQNLENEHFSKGILSACIPGQIQKVNIQQDNTELSQNEIIIDFATNQLGASQITEYIKNEYNIGKKYRNNYVIISMDYKYNAIGLIGEIRPILKQLIIVNNKNTLHPVATEELVNIGKRNRISNIVTFQNLKDAIKSIADNDPFGRIVIIGCSSLSYDILKDKDTN